ncbi:MAG: hypothetical protein J07HQW1_00141 [Haloquadratum walsbyi J07HQW1]|jgi:hypothetical protein|uniref:Uncharacterized protein n=1 Tax=Haloquadratum walsbyi J07HQW1 TaxID=1238424 RepID=U1N1B6_9EURY|nr:MAG: hypothetical protein J07HQW1_00141 [Haloquadratum walsbyi J07HQW1]
MTTIIHSITHQFKLLRRSPRERKPIPETILRDAFDENTQKVIMEDEY